MIAIPKFRESAIISLVLQHDLIIQCLLARMASVSRPRKIIHQRHLNGV